jgi:ABC-type transport system involved in cytochrome c biogenesis permease component
MNMRELLREVAAVWSLEVRKRFWGRRALWIYLLALAPVLICGGHSLSQMRRTHVGCTIGEDMQIYAGIFQFFYLRLGIFFGCVGIFSNLIRADVLDKTLHYYLLTPVRREALIAGKYLSGLTAAVPLFVMSVAASYVLVAIHFGELQMDFLTIGPGGRHLGWYLVTTALACAGYGAVFLLAGLLFQNPMITAAIVTVWEAGNAFLPAVLARISVIHYLKSLTPVDVPVDAGPFALLVAVIEPTPPEIAIPGVLALAALAVGYACQRARRFEISYTD